MIAYVPETCKIASERAIEIQALSFPKSDPSENKCSQHRFAPDNWGDEDASLSLNLCRFLISDETSTCQFLSDRRIWTYVIQQTGIDQIGQGAAPAGPASYSSC